MTYARSAAATLVLIMFALPIVAAPDETDTMRAGFSVELIQADADDAIMEINGDLLWRDPMLRVDAVNPVTGEEVIFLVDLKSEDAIVLYPDTLNGYQVGLPAIADDERMGMARSLLSQWMLDTPDGWKRAESSTTEFSGKNINVERVSDGEGLTIELWSDSEGTPVRITGKGEDMTISASFHDVERGIEIGATDFAVPEGYVLTERDDLPEAELLSL